MSGEHARLAPSSAPIWVNCPGSVSAAERCGRDRETEAANEGTAAHAVAQRKIERYLATIWETKVPARHVLGDTVENVVVTQEILNGAEVMAGHCIEVQKNTGCSDPECIGLEERLSCSDIHDDCWGTPDFFLCDLNAYRIHVVDFKFGYSDRDPFEDWQLLVYAIGVWQLARERELNPRNIPWKFSLTTVQPRNYHGYGGPIRTWETDQNQIVGSLKAARTAAEKAFVDHDYRQTGPHCRYCKARHACSAAMDAGAMLFESAMAGDVEPFSLGYRLSIVNRALEQLNLLHTGLEAEISERIRSGEDVTGWALETTFGRTVWKDAKQAMELGDLLGIDLRKQDVAITPKQAIDSGMDAETVGAMSHRPKTGTKLVPEESILKQAKEIFK